MNMLISEATVGLIEEFSSSWGGGALRCYPMKIAVTMRHVTLIFFQPERYSRLLRCYFDFGDDVSFFYEDMRAAIENNDCLEQSGMSEISQTDELRANDNFVRDVIRFCRDHEDEITKLPPPWFPAAMQISDNRTRKNFPELADADLQRKQLFLQRLNKSIG
jgi:hypothetical protein